METGKEWTRADALLLEELRERVDLDHEAGALTSEEWITYDELTDREAAAFRARGW